MEYRDQDPYFDPRKNTKPQTSSSPIPNAQPASGFQPYDLSKPIPGFQPNWRSALRSVKDTFANSTLGARVRPRNNQPAPTPAAPNNAPPPNMPTPGPNGYTPTTAPYGMDQTNPGVQEQFWNQNQNLWTKGAFQGPGQGEQFWNQVQGSFNTNNNLQPQFDAAYDRGRDKAVGAANAQAAARGAYGSSVALNNVGNIIGDWEANRGKAATDFALANAENQRAQLGAYGNLAFGAQNAGLANRVFDLNSLSSAFAASGAAQNQRDKRIQGAFDNTFNQQNALLGYYGPALEQLFRTDEDVYSAGVGAGPAVTAAGIAANDRSADRNMQTAQLGLGLYGAFGPRPAPSTPVPQSNPGYSSYGGYARNY